MGHVEQRSSRVSLNAHILRLSQADERAQRARSSDLGLVLFVCGQIRDATHRIALHLHVRRHHLADQRGQPSKGDDQDLVLTYVGVSD